MDPGSGLSRVQAFLLNSLRPSTMHKYVEALEAFNSDTKDSPLNWGSLSDADKDVFLAEWVLDSYEDGKSKNNCSWTLSAVSKVCPRLQLKTAWKVMDAWHHLVPVRQAPAAPPQLIQAMVVLAICLGRPDLAYVGLLRIREVLNLQLGDVVFDASQVILCLGQTKASMEQKVVLQNPSVVAWIGQFLVWRRQTVSHGPLFTISYSSVLRWVKKLTVLLGTGSLQLTTHTFRRPGASELARQGMPLADVMLYGRWLSDKAARSHIRSNPRPHVHPHIADKPQGRSGSAISTRSTSREEGAAKVTGNERQISPRRRTDHSFAFWKINTEEVVVSRSGRSQSQSDRSIGEGSRSRSRTPVDDAPLTPKIGSDNYQARG
eukprot:s463_g4.t1